VKNPRSLLEIEGYTFEHSNGTMITVQTNPTRLDSDQDGIYDNIERDYGYDPTDPSDGGDDSDQDGLSNFMELQVCYTDPYNNDTDNDNFLDGLELEYWLVVQNEDMSNATMLLTEPDSEYWFEGSGDGILDGDEVLIYNTNPTTSDTDNDLMDDLWEVTFGTNPIIDDANIDSDSDGWLNDPFTNLEEFQKGTHPLFTDTDFDGMSDVFEAYYGLMCLNPIDASDDNDLDGLSNLEEYTYKTNPILSDTDSDGLDDLEVADSHDPLDTYDINTQPATPEAENLESTSISIEITWSNSYTPGTEYYNVYLFYDNGSLLFDYVYATYLVVENLQPGVNYTIKIKAYSNYGSSILSESILLETNTPPVSILSSISSSANEITIAWDEPNCGYVSEYNIWSSWSPSSYFGYLGTTNLTNYTDTTLEPDQTRYYRVSVVYLSGEESDLSVAVHQQQHCHLLQLNQVNHMLILQKLQQVQLPFVGIPQNHTWIIIFYL